LTDYLRDQGFSEPREKANRLIQQLRDRNFILCYRGADTYGFMHRTFLEYFCAVEIVHRFEKQRTLTFEQLRDEVFGQHWQDETWQEVLCLVIGRVYVDFSVPIIDHLMKHIKEAKELIYLASYLLEVENYSEGVVKTIHSKMLGSIVNLAEEFFKDLIKETFEIRNTIDNLEATLQKISQDKYVNNVVRKKDQTIDKLILVFREQDDVWQEEISRYNADFDPGAWNLSENVKEIQHLNIQKSKLFHYHKLLRKTRDNLSDLPESNLD